ncbi:amidase [Novosphingobium mangrovi (ex Huang et al. 2023)]|uniref:Amidase n=1 Tax=Novosphingobium mangrovi (ex Huang et al. 2023) TaxID=2976432 RepID=A0ABT2I0Y1_9SPHN|nr:amidase [Novosphingobium mangrovi (ex Huang et al. 2023)]MCT2398462.1 amidase [Novosphingobium mangrovi (ex Huang et al. 2023)]
MQAGVAVATNIEAVQSAWNPFSAILEAQPDPSTPKGTLAGVAVSVKDILDVAGAPTRWGSLALQDAAPAERDMEAVARLRQAGASIVAKTTTTEFAHSPLGYSSLTGMTLNPWNPRMTCGGSSSGAGVAVVTGATPLALATDAGCSTRLPAALTGVFGLKATSGRIPHEKVPEGFASIVHLGLLARDVDVLERGLVAVAGPHRSDPQSLSQPDLRIPHPGSDGDALAGRRIAIWRFAGNAVLDDDVECQMVDAAKVLADAGARVDWLEYPLENPTRHWAVLQEVSWAARVAALPARLGERLSLTFRDGAARGREATALGLSAALAGRTAVFRAVQRVFAAGYDFILTPCAAAAAIAADHPTDAPLEIGGRSVGPLRDAWVPYLSLFNLSGHPAITLPSGLDRNGVPMGLQLVAPWWEEHRLLAAARAWEAACPPPTMES